MDNGLGFFCLSIQSLCGEDLEIIVRSPQSLSHQPLDSLPGPFGVCSGVETQEGWVRSCPGSQPRALWGSHQPLLGIVAPLLSKDHVTNIEACFLSMC